MLSAKWIPDSGQRKQYGFRVFVASCLFSAATIGKHFPQFSYHPATWNEKDFELQLRPAPQKDGGSRLHSGPSLFRVYLETSDEQVSENSPASE
ncbi:unnamed protein product [Toxocara canis]|uniref:Uncharacterized protein n=1 Tax=Toxocara canis TaxID=6265 RepID=A0A183ULU6_TOXCA|nr:unnamed protein product [Toxocara canis]